MSLNKRLMSSQPAPFVASENFKVVTYTGNGGTQSINVGFKPDFVWIKQRNAANHHRLLDSTRGATKILYSSLNYAEDTESTGLTAFTSTGFNLGAQQSVNDNNDTYVAWCWKAGGGTTSTNTDGANIDSTVQVNANAGFSIVKWTGTGNAAHTVGHGLGVTPNMVISKNLDAADTWQVYHSGGGIQAGTSGTLIKYGGHLDSNAAFNTSAGTHGAWDNPSSTALTFSNGSSSIDNLNTNNEDYIAYCFADIDGFSKFSAYEGNGSANGPIIETGFEPAFIIVKNVTSSGQDWRILDNKRNTSNPRNCYLSANTNSAEECQYNQFDFLSNGFKVITTDGSLNQNNSKFIYMAFAADPDEVAPTLASSFNIETWTGTGGARSITGLGFSPNLVWYKERSSTSSHELLDTLRGPTNYIMSSSSNAQASSAQGLQSFDSDGFSVGTDGAVNESGETYVGWTWKADDNEPTIFGGPAKTVYKFEDNANDVTGAYNASASNVSYVTGYFNKAAEFNGSNSTMFLASSGSSLVDYDSNFSISLWFNVSSWASEASTDFLWTGGGTRIINITLTGSTGLQVDIWNSGSHLVSTTGLSENTWYHLVFTRSKASGMKLYIDGSLVDTNLYIGNAGSLSGKQDSIGTYWDNTRNNFTGKIDQFRIYDGVVTDDDVTALYAETASQNDDLTLGGPPQILVSANANAGFSISQATFASEGTIPHGLSSAPNFVILKGVTAAEDWLIYHSSLGTGKYLSFSRNGGTDGATTRADSFSSVTATTVTNDWTSSNVKWIMYSFHNVTGYQKFGGYTGNGGNNRSITGLGFKPDFVMIKATSMSSDWSLFDSRRSGNKTLATNESAAEVTNDSNGYILSFDSDGFTTQVGSSDDVNVNNFNETYIYWAIAKNVPSNTTLANSFKTVEWDGTGNTNAITGLGFRPDLVWLKNQEAGTYYNLSDSVRGALKYIPSNANTAEETTQDSFRSFDSDGFTVGSANGFNNANKKFVAWCWKAGNTWQSNLDGSIDSITNTNTANGFSIIKYTGNNTAGATIGHGLTSAPEMVIVRQLDIEENWTTGNSYLNGGTNPWDYVINLNNSNAESNQSWPWNDTAPSSSVITLGSGGGINNSGGKFIVYCWHSVSGYSKFGSYTGNATAGTNITVGFQPDWILTKRIDGADNWRLYDSVRQHSNAFDLPAYINDAGETIYGSGAANNTGVTGVTSTAFTLGNGNLSNGNGHKYIYMAFKAN